MEKIVECVPNISEGRNQEVVEAVVDEVRAVEGVRLLDYSSDTSHNRSVITFVGDMEPVKEAAFRLVKKAGELIDLDQHTGEHPRMGATDVLPFIPISGVQMEECVAAAEEVGRRIGEELGIPVFLYGEAARVPERKNLAKIRKGQYEKLKELLASERIPDFGPQTMPKMGATAVGARMPLVAYNINLNTAKKEIADKIARCIRGSGGGFHNVKAMGVFLEDKGIAQVSMNLENFEKTPIFRVFEAVKREAQRYGVNVIGSEIIGLIPQKALTDAADFFLQLEDFTPEQILENKIFRGE